MSVYRLLERYDGTVESLYEKSRKPHSHKNQQTSEEYRLIKKVWLHNERLGLVCLHMVLEDKHGYTRCVSSLYRAMKKMEMGCKKQRKKSIYPNPTIHPKWQVNVSNRCKVCTKRVSGY